MKTKARLIEVRNEQSEFADFIDYDGELCLNGPSGPNWFSANGDILSLTAKRILYNQPDEKNGKVTVFTKLGNRFVFQMKPQQ